MIIIDFYKKWRKGCIFNECYKHAELFLQNYPQPRLSKDEKDEIDCFWAKYGIKWPDYSWFQMFYGVSGIKSPYYIPDPLASKVLYPYYNNSSYINGWDDKNLYERILPNVQFPNSLCHCIKNRLYDEQWTPIDNSDKSVYSLAKKIMDRKMSSDVIVKKTSKTNSGKGVKLYHIKTIDDLVKVIRTNISNNFIMQEKLVQHPIMSKFCSTSVNIIRIVSLRYGNDVLLFPASVRFGTEGYVTDVSFIDGKETVHVMGINKDGTVNGRLVSLDGRLEPKSQIANITIPSFKSICDTIKTAHMHMYYFDLIGWDFAINEREEPICIEYNVIWPGTILYQYTNGPFCGNYTQQFLEPLKTEMLQRRIPAKYKL